MKRLLILISPLLLAMASPISVQSDEAHYDGSQVILTGHVVITGEMGRVNADQAVIDRIQREGSWSASQIILLGHVQMANCENTQFALADRVNYFPQEKVMLFEASEGERVLFYDTVKQMQLSAHKLRAERQESDRVQGYGDVRFVFGADEWTKFKQHFQWETQ